MLLNDFGSIFPERFGDLIDQLGVLRSRRDQVHRSHVQSSVILVQAFVGTTWNGRGMEERVLVDQ